MGTSQLTAPFPSSNHTLQCGQQRRKWSSNVCVLEEGGGMIRESTLVRNKCLVGRGVDNGSKSGQLGDGRELAEL